MAAVVSDGSRDTKADSVTRAEIDLEAMAAEVMEADVVVLGELHDSAAAHALQLGIIERLARLGGELVISMEMFERDVQPVLDAYIAGEIDESEFLAKARPWNTHAEFYRPIVEFAKQRGIPVVAANIPRSLARVASKKGAEGLRAAVDEGEAEASWFAASSTAPEDRYWDEFQGAMAGHPGVTVESMRGPYVAQCYKDDTMAESIVTALDRHPEATVVHLTGRFHSDYRLGTVARVIARRPDLRVVVVSTVRRDDAEEIASDLADYVWIVSK